MEPARPARPIFRAKALEQRGRPAELSPPSLWAKPKALAVLWGLALLTSVSVGLVARIEIPVYAGGVAVGAGAKDAGRTAVLVDSDAADELKVGQSVHVEVGQDLRSAELVVERVEPAPLSVESARRRFGLSGLADPGREGYTVLLGVLAMGDEPEGPPAAAAWPVRVEVGTRRLSSLFRSSGPAQQ